MNKYEITIPNLGTYQVESEQPLSDEQVYAAVAPQAEAERQRLLSIPFPTDGIGEEAPQTQLGPVGRGIANVIKGAVVDPIEAGIQLFGGEEGRRAVAEREAAYQAGRQARGESGIELGRLAGAVASPLTLIPALGAARGVSAIGGGAMRQAAAAGVAGAATQPVSNSPEDISSFLADKVEQLGAGAVLGGLTQAGLTAASKAGSFLRDLASPLTKGGRDRVLREKLEELTGPQRDEVINAIRNAPELVPGSRPTVAQASGDFPTATGLASFEQKLASTPGVSPLFAQRTAQQQAARESLIRDFAKTPEQLELAQIARSVDADRNYGLAFSYSISADPRLARLATNPYFRDALPDAIKLAEAKGISAKTDLTEFLQGVKISLDKQLSKTGDLALAKAEKGQVARVKSDLVKWLGQKNPAFERARAQFAEASEPINEMQVGQYLLDKLRTPLDQERAGAFGLAVRNAATTIRKSTGEPRFEKLGQVISKQAEKDVNSVLADLTRAQRAIESGKKTSLGSLTLDNTPELPNLLSRPALLVNSVLRAVKGDSVEELNRRAAELFLNPEAFATFMSAVPKSKVQSIANAMYGRLTPENRQLLQATLGAQIGVELQSQQ